MSDDATLARTVTHDDLGPWEPLAPEEAFDLLRALRVPWWIAGGWAIDLFVGHQTREHHDLDVGVLRRDEPLVYRALEGWQAYAAADGKLHEIRPCEPHTAHSVWCRPAADAPWALQLMLDDHAGEDWIFRRDPHVKRPLNELVRRTEGGLPYLTPEVQLLFKAKAVRPRDEADFATVRPLLDAAERGWLSSALRRVHPGHPWLASL